MSKVIFTFTLMFMLSICNAQTPTWQWSYQGGSADNDAGHRIVTDRFGSIYTTGYFLPPSITFGNITLNTSTISGSDAFVAKYDASGNVLWAKSIGGTFNEYGNAITTDILGNVYVAGSFNSPSILFNNDTLLNSGTTNVFIVKFDSLGNEVWGTRAGGTGMSSALGISVDFFRRPCVTGTYTNSSISFGSTTLVNSGQADIFVAKFDAVGSPLWAKKIGSNDYEQSTAICSDLLGNIYTTGIFYGNTISIDTSTLSNGGAFNYYIAKFDPSGILLWKNSAGLTGSNGALASSMIIDGAGNSYVTGVVIGTGISILPYTLNSVSSYNDILLVKYDVFGNVLFARSYGGIYSETVSGISKDLLGNLYITGYYQFGNAQIGTSTLPLNGILNSYVTKFDSLGNTNWSLGFGGTESDISSGVTTDANGGVYITGQFKSPSITFGGSTLINASNNVSADYFISKIGTATGISVGTASSSSTTVYPSPFSDFLNVKTDNPSPSEIILYDTASRILLRKIFNNSTSINTTHLAKGFYIYEVRQEKIILSKGKVLKN